MTVTREEVLRIAALCRLDPAEEDVAGLVAELQAILDTMAKLGEVDTCGVAPTAHPLDLPLPLRDDASRPGLSAEEALGAAPCARDGQFVVPRVL